MELFSGIGTYVIPFLIVLTIVVFVHEFGHYYIARINGVRVDAFSVGFGRELFGYTDSHGTRWKFCVIPLGGYVKMHGDADAASATADPNASADADSFPAKTVGQRAAIVFAGPGANFIFSIIVLALLFMLSGRPFTPAVVADVREDSPAAAAGLVTDDRVIAVDGQEIDSFESLQGVVRDQAEVPLIFTIDRAGDTFDVTVVPELQELTDRFGNTHRVGLIGVSSAGVEFQQADPLTAITASVTETVNMITGTLGALWEMIVGSRGSEDLGGPLRIAQMSGQIAQDGIVPAIWFVAVLSINLGLINLFPIPMLDGGHLVLYSIEAARGRPLTERSQEIAFRIGVAMVMSLMVFATWNDLVHLDVIQRLTGLFS